MASSDFLRSIGCHFGLRLIDALTVLAALTAQDLVRSLTLPSAHAVARNAEGDHRFPSPSISDGCCLRRYTGDSTTPIPDSPSDTRPGCHDGANAFPFGTA
jgi:hypothetical protein